MLKWNLGNYYKYSGKEIFAYQKILFRKWKNT